ncbi:diaminopropionate ammonia-lyase [Pusillimonas caeni]|uniref:diaminopropionate ammonia-lyase n=1 Tax=Pusillimonas caeni TaxID=1348472 RepID=UPI000E59F3D5|nr:diaminopropionate ammonia-lyase [Pusillimonas caeni]TFL08820.1 diaminopropionate ammonia-lyase [Pusillimonas caeni]
MLIKNKLAARAAYPDDLRAIMNLQRAEESREWLSHWRMLSPEPTPLVSLPGVARTLRLGSVLLKDESKRSPLGSFKALGASIALVRLILRHFPSAGYTAQSLFAGEHAQALKDFTVVSATAGNHGCSLAAAARDIGCRCVIVLSEQVNPDREKAIASHGAEIVRVKGDYDDSVEHAESLAKSEGWLVVSDTSYDGYEEIPRDVMQGYATIPAEAIGQSNASNDAEPPYTHVFLQGGVGGMAAGLAAYFWERYGARRPTLIVVEPEQADCLYQSALAGHAASATGSIDSVMAGLACGETSPLAWRFLQPSADFFMTISDASAISAMKTLAYGEYGDTPVVSGGSGAAGLASLIELANDAGSREDVGLDESSKVLLINTEGATAPTDYLAQVGKTADEILKTAAEA